MGATYTGKYNWEMLKKEFFDPIDAAVEAARKEESKLRRELWNFESNDKIANSEHEYIVLMLNKEHPEFIETYQEYLKVNNLYWKAYNRVERSYEATYADDWDPQGTVGGAMAANDYVGSAIDEKEKLDTQREALLNTGLGKLIDQYHKEYREINGTDAIYRHPNIIAEKRKKCKEAYSIYRKLNAHKLKDKFSKIEDFKDDNTLISIMSYQDYTELATTLKNSATKIYPYYDTDYRECTEITLDLETDENGDNSSYYLDVELIGTSEGDDGTMYHVKGEINDEITFDRNQTSVGQLVTKFFEIIEKCNENFHEDYGYPYEADEYPNYPY